MSQLAAVLKKWHPLFWALLAFLWFAGEARFSTLAERVTHCDDNGFLLNALGAKSAAQAADAIAQAWTYAPGQFYAGFPFWSRATQWDQIIQQARMPSALAATLGTLCFFGILYLLQARSNAALIGGVFTAMLAALSMREMVESQQGYSYAVTFPCAALQLLVTLWVAGRGTAWTRWIYAAAAAAALGAFGLLFSYQMVFPTVAAVAACVLISVVEMRKSATSASGRMLPAVAAIVSLAAFAGVYGWLWKSYLGALVKAGSNVPSWAKFEVLTVAGEGGTWAYLMALAKKLPLLMSYLTLPVWPALLGQTTILVWGLVISAIAAWGLWRGVRSEDPAHQLTALYGGIAILILFAANVAGQIPFGVTRHSFVLFVPVLALVLLGELSASHTSRSRSRWMKIALVGLLFFSVRFDDYNAITKNQFDVARISKEVQTRNPLSLVTLDCTWDPRIFQTITQSAAYPCGVVEDPGPVLRTLTDRTQGGTILLTSHRADPLGSLQGELLKHPEWKTERIVALAPTGSSEPAGMLNGGNGFYLVSVTRPATIVRGCAVQFGGGWGSQEGTPENWWRWSARGGKIAIVSSAPDTVSLRGLLGNVTGPNVVRVKRNGNLVQEILLAEASNIDIEIPVDIGETEIELESRNPGIKLPPDTRTFALQLREFKASGKTGGACALQP